jgi:hypothetical protein
MRSFILLTLSLAIAPGPVEARCVVGVPPGNVLRLRAGPSASRPVVGFVTRKACGIAVHRCQSDWCQVRRGGMRGWAVKDFISGPNDSRPLRARVAQRLYRTRPAQAPEWEFLGARSIDSAHRNDRIDIPSDGKFRALQLVAKGAAVEVAKVRAINAEGVAEDLAIQQFMEAGTSSGALDLRAEQTLKEVELTYGLADNAGQAEVQVFGLTSSEPLASPKPSWRLLGSRSPTFAKDTDPLSVGLPAGKFRALQLAVDDVPVYIDSLMVTYGDGRSVELPIHKSIQAWGRSEVIVLNGPPSAIQSIRFVYMQGPPLTAGYVRVYGLREGA